MEESKNQERLDQLPFIGVTQINSEKSLKLQKKNLLKCIFHP